MKMPRTSLENAVHALLENLPENTLVTPNELSKQLQIHWKTIMKAAKLVISVQNKIWKENMLLDLQKIGKTYGLKFSRNFEKMSRKERLAHLRNVYFQEPNKEDFLFVELLKRNAINARNAIRIRKDKLVSRLLQQGQLAENESGRIYLTDEGYAVAKGTLKLFPELK